MSIGIEAALAELTASVKELTAANKHLLSAIVADSTMRQKALEKAENMFSEGTVARRGRPPKSETAPAAEPKTEDPLEIPAFLDRKKAEAPKAPEAPKVVTRDDVAAAGAAIIRDFPKGHKQHEQMIDAMVALRKELGVQKFVDASPDLYAQIIAWFGQIRAGEKINFAADQPVEEDLGV